METWMKMEIGENNKEPFPLILEKEVKFILDRVKADKVLGIDGMENGVLMVFAVELTVPLTITKLFNLMIEKGKNLKSMENIRNNFII